MISPDLKNFSKEVFEWAYIKTFRSKCTRTTSSIIKGFLLYFSWEHETQVRNNYSKHKRRYVKHHNGKSHPLEVQLSEGWVISEGSCDTKAAGVKQMMIELSFSLQNKSLNLRNFLINSSYTEESKK